MDPRYFDTHSHPHFSNYAEDRDDMLARMEEHHVWTVAVGTGIEKSRQAIAIAESKPYIWASIGIHPNDLDETFDVAVFDEMAKHERVVAVGECGLDYFRIPDEVVVSGRVDAYKKHQSDLFMQHIEFAHRHDLPLILHIRPAKNDMAAHHDALAILADNRSRVRGICHFFTGPADIALKYVEIGFSVAFPGVVTFAQETHAAVKAVPLERIVAETDAPYAAPNPYRGKRNEPSYVREIYRTIAEIRGEDEERVRSVLTENARKIYAI